ncbi:hypothetical protein D3C71_1302260 [compost metagenome]
MSRFEIRDPVVVDDFYDAHLIDIACALLAFVMIDENNLLGFACHLLNQAGSFNSEVVQRIFRFGANFAKANSLHVPAQLFLESGIGDSGTNRIGVGIFMPKDQCFFHFQAPYFGFCSFNISHNDRDRPQSVEPNGIVPKYEKDLNTLYVTVKIIVT